MTDDDRITCITCAHRKPGQFGGMACHRAKAAGLNANRDVVELGRDLATLPQRCPAYTPKPTPKEQRHAPA